MSSPRCSTAEDPRAQAYLDCEWGGRCAPEAQFEPTNPIPVLQLVPTPTGLAEEQQTGRLLVTAAPCELPSPKTCLEDLEGWPVDTPITLYFSEALDEATVSAGVKLFAVHGDRWRQLSFRHAIQDPRPAPNDACMSGGNGSAVGKDSDLTYGSEQILPGVALILTPTAALQANTTHVLLAESSEAGGLRTSEGRPFSRSGWFDVGSQSMTDAPVSDDGTVNDPLLRCSFERTLTSQLFNVAWGWSELSSMQQAELELEMKMRAVHTIPLFTWFDEIVDRAVAAGVTERDQLVYANHWQTHADPNVGCY